MQRVARTTAASAGAETSLARYIGYLLAGVGAALACTGIGLVVAWVQGELPHFIDEWVRLQGFPLLAIGVWLCLIVRSGSFPDRIKSAMAEGVTPPRGIRRRELRLLVVSAVWVFGTASLIAMGFDAHGPILGYFWLTCATICLMAGVTTMHTIEIILTMHRLRPTSIKTFHYAPARTPELRQLISYFTFFTCVLSVGYAFAFAGTLYGHWTAHQLYIEAVRFFWPTIYVPICSVALIYPHLIIHKLIRQAKERTLMSCEAEIDGLLERYKELNNEDVQRVNTLTQLFDRIAATPNYIIDVGIIARTSLPLLLNVGMVAAKAFFPQT
jgi:hypothetical protein